MKRGILMIAVALSLTGSALPAEREDGTASRDHQGPLNIAEVRAYPKVFHPVRGETVTISYSVSKPAKAVVKIFGPDMTLVKELWSRDSESPGRSEVIWNGRDLEERLVPDEAYFFTIEASDYEGILAAYDPTAFSGGEHIEDLPVAFNRAKRKVSYELAQDARVKIRAGISRGPLLKTIANWAPRLAGKNQETWDGKDDSGEIDVVGLEGYTLLAEAITLPANSILTVGNESNTYFAYKNEVASSRPTKSQHLSLFRKRVVMASQFGDSFPERWVPRFHLELPRGSEMNEGGIPVLKGKVPVKIYLDEEIKRYATEQRYEIICFVDFAFVTEREEGYSPSTWVWDTRSLPNGEHILTINVATLKGQLASASIKAFIRN